MTTLTTHPPQRSALAAATRLMLLDMMMMTRGDGGLPAKDHVRRVREMGLSPHERIQHEKPDAGRTLVFETP
jgi:hypothetical protein